MMGFGREFGGRYGNMMGAGEWGGLLFLFFGTLVVVGIVVLIIWAVRATSGGHGSGGVVPPASATGQDEAMQIVRRRLATGEITKEQYDEIMNALAR